MSSSDADSGADCTFHPLDSAHLTKLFWSINGLASVLGAAIAIAVSINSGFSTALLFATGFYIFVVSVISKLR